MHQTVMKYYIILILFFTVSIAQAQNNVRLYAYTQDVTPGIAAKERDQDGKIIKKTTDKTYHYFMYLASSSKSKIYPVALWIKGEQVGVKSEAVNTIPVVLTTDNGTLQPNEVILVPKTKAKVFQLTGTSGGTSKEFPKAKTLSNTNELVLVYKLNGKFYYASQKKFAELSPSTLQ